MSWIKEHSWVLSHHITSAEMLILEIACETIGITASYGWAHFSLNDKLNGYASYSLPYNTLCINRNNLSGKLVTFSEVIEAIKQQHGKRLDIERS